MLSFVVNIFKGITRSISRFSRMCTCSTDYHCLFTAERNIITTNTVKNFSDFILMIVASINIAYIMKKNKHSETIHFDT